MLCVTHEDAALLRGLTAELGLSDPQEAADMAIDLYAHGMAMTGKSGVAYRLDPTEIYWVSPVAQYMLRAIGPARTFSPSMCQGDDPGSDPNPPRLSFSHERLNLIYLWKRTMDLPSPDSVLANAIEILHAFVLANRRGNTIIVCRKHSTLHARSCPAAHSMKLNLPLHRERSLSN
jgi:hypothetical protein